MSWYEVTFDGVPRSGRSTFGGQTPTLYGSEAQTFDELDDVATTSSAFQLYASHTTSVLAGGRYELKVTMAIAGSANSTDIAAELRINGFAVELGPKQAIAGGSNGILYFSGVFVAPLPAAAHPLEIYFRRAGGTGSVTALRSAIILTRFS